MDGYSPSSVTRLPEEEQVLAGDEVETTEDGSLIVRFRRPLRSPLLKRHYGEARYLSAETPGKLVSEKTCSSNQASSAPLAPTAVLYPSPGSEEATIHEPAEQDVSHILASLHEVGNPVDVVRADLADELEPGLAWLDPRQNGVMVIWAYGSRSWPSYHDATGSFVLPLLVGDDI